MATALKRSIALLLVLVLAFGMIPTAFAEETEATDSTIPTEETLTDETGPQESATVPEKTTVPTGNTEPPVLFLEANSIEALGRLAVWNLFLCKMHEPDLRPPYHRFQGQFQRIRFDCGNCVR